MGILVEVISRQPQLVVRFAAGAVFKEEVLPMIWILEPRDSTLELLDLLAAGREEGRKGGK
jgi:hypothetical protein